eukprot:gnl/TRDRNA2_/TRDRNA2_180245_c0_seq1.p1 gnl/TRDRNA2_/TRDRNA2_180245_c0~~gnl/TRDRNA2_/TRDRNA2_180245_c0_seq1.p1  ORF type:complete len:530 (+),score=104.31 gnl/TRDRNA2_/TRDRNA2_180245_c0_seq1:73-1590(+)
MAAVVAEQERGPGRLAMERDMCRELEEWKAQKEARTKIFGGTKRRCPHPGRTPLAGASPGRSGRIVSDENAPWAVNRAPPGAAKVVSAVGQSHDSVCCPSTPPKQRLAFASSPLSEICPNTGRVTEGTQRQRMPLRSPEKASTPTKFVSCWAVVPLATATTATETASARSSSATPARTPEKAAASTSSLRRSPDTASKAASPIKEGAQLVSSGEMQESADAAEASCSISPWDERRQLPRVPPPSPTMPGRAWHWTIDPSQLATKRPSFFHAALVAALSSEDVLFGGSFESQRQELLLGELEAISTSAPRLQEPTDGKALDVCRADHAEGEEQGDEAESAEMAQEDLEVDEDQEEEEEIDEEQHEDEEAEAAEDLRDEHIEWLRRIARHRISWPAQTALEVEDHLCRASDLLTFWFFESRERVFSAVGEWESLTDKEPFECIHEYPPDWPQWRKKSYDLREQARAARAEAARNRTPTKSAAGTLDDYLPVADEDSRYSVLNAPVAE